MTISLPSRESLHVEFKSDLKRLSDTELVSLLFQCLRGRGRFLDERGVALRHFIHLRHSDMDLGDTLTLLRAGNCDLLNEVRHAEYRGGNGLHCLPGPTCHERALFNLGKRSLD